MTISRTPQSVGLLLVILAGGCAHDAQRCQLIRQAPLRPSEARLELPADGRPRDLVPTNFLSPEQQAGEQLGSRLSALLRD